MYSIVHNEYKPEGDDSWYYSWYNTLTFAVSTDTGRTYTHDTPPNHFVAGIPYQYSAGYPYICGKIYELNRLKTGQLFKKNKVLTTERILKRNLGEK